jgi:hypothetical protein
MAEKLSSFAKSPMVVIPRFSRNALVSSEIPPLASKKLHISACPL